VAEIEQRSNKNRTEPNAIEQGIWSCSEVYGKGGNSMPTWRGIWFFLFVFGELAVFYYGVIGADWRLIIAMTILAIVAISVVHFEWYR
jgi:hypothetical protein